MSTTDASHASDLPDADAETAPSVTPERPLPTDAMEPDARPAPVTAADRVQNRPGSEPRTDSRPRRLPWLRLLILGLIGGAVVAALTLRGGSTEPDSDLLERLGVTAETFRPDLVTVDQAAAERYVLDAFGWPVAAPQIPGLQLVGVGESSVLTTAQIDVGLPAFRYDTQDGESLVVFVYDYVLLDGTGGALDLAEPVYARLAETPSVDVRRQDGVSFVSWRVRSVIYTAVTDNEDTAEQIARSVSS